MMETSRKEAVRVRFPPCCMMGGTLFVCVHSDVYIQTVVCLLLKEWEDGVRQSEM